MDLLRAVSETAADPIFAKDGEGRMLMANPATLSVAGRTAAEVIGRTELEWIGDTPEAHTIMENDRRVMESARSLTVREVLHTPEGLACSSGRRRPCATWTAA